MMHSGSDTPSEGVATSPPKPGEGGPQQAVIDLPQSLVRKQGKDERESCFGQRFFSNMGHAEGLSMKGWWGRCQAYLARMDFTWTCREIRDVKLDTETLRKMKNTFWLSRILFLRLLAFVYFFAFLSAFQQNQGLIGSSGISPAADVVEKAQKEFSDLRGWDRVKAFPSLFLLLPATNFWLEAIPFLGMLTALGIFIAGAANAVFLLVLWLFYQSLVSVGQEWYFFGWEFQLLETGFLAIWLCPFWSCSRFPLSWPTPKVCVWGSRWLLFRVMLGAGLIKLRQDESWRDLTALNYHFETQSLPTPLSWYFHQQAPWLHVAEAVGCILMNCVVPFFVLIPRRQCRLIGGTLLIVYQLLAALSGNTSFLNFLTIVPAIMCLDDHFLTCVFSVNTLERMTQATKGCAGEWSCPLKQGWPLDRPEERKETAQVDSESQALLGQDSREKETLPLSNVRSPPRSCLCWYWPDFVGFLKRCRMPRGTVDAATRHIQARCWKVLGEMTVAAAIIACALRLSEPLTYAVWEVIGLFFLVLFQGAFSAFVARTKASYIFTEVILSFATFVSFMNLFAYGPEVWSVWLTSCLVTVMIIFSYSTLRNAALVAKLHVELLLLTLLIVFSIPVVRNLLSPHQLSDANFEPFQIVNTYGALGTVHKERYELVIQGTDDIEVDHETKWHDYEFNCKPTNLQRPPCFSAPYHHRLDWLMRHVSTEEKHWAMQRHKWFPRFLHELLKNNPSVTALLHRNPFAGKDPPTHIRVLRAQYRFTSSKEYGPLSRGPWWEIRKGSTEVYVPPEEIPGSQAHLNRLIEERKRRQKEEEAKAKAEEEARRRREEEKELERRLEAAKRAADELRKKQEEAERKRQEEERRKKAQEEAERQKKKAEEEAEAARKRREAQEAEAEKIKQEAKAKAEAERKAREKEEQERKERDKAEQEARKQEEQQRQEEEKRKQIEQEQKAREAQRQQEEEQKRQQEEEKRRHDLEAQEAAQRQKEEKRRQEEEEKRNEQAEQRAKKQAAEEAERQRRLQLLEKLKKHKLGGVPLREAPRLSKKAHRHTAGFPPQ